MTIQYTYVDGPFGRLHARYVRPAEHTGRTPVVCLHPNPMSGRLYEPLLKELGRDRMAVAFDTPGCGNSAPPPEQLPLPRYAAAIAKGITALGLSSVDLLGAQTGARISVALAESVPPLVRRLVLIHAPVYTGTERETAQKNYAPPVIHEDGSHLSVEWTRLIGQVPHPDNLGLVSDLFCDMSLGLGEPHRVWIVRANGGYPYEDHLPSVEKQILVLNPTGFLREATSRIGPLLRNGRVMELDYSLPTGMLFRAAEIGKILRDFLDRAQG